MNGKSELNPLREYLNSLHIQALELELRRLGFKLFFCGKTWLHGSGKNSSIRCAIYIELGNNFSGPLLYCEEKYPTGSYDSIILEFKEKMLNEEITLLGEAKMKFCLHKGRLGTVNA